MDSERIVGNPRPFLPMIEFNDYLYQCGLFDLLNIDQSMSWCNGHIGVARSWAKLCRALINNSFLNDFGLAQYKYLSRKSVDHCLVMVHTSLMFIKYGPTPFRFMNMWSTHDLFLSCIKDAWIRNDTDSGLLKLAIRL